MPMPFVLCFSAFKPLGDISEDPTVCLSGSDCQNILSFRWPSFCWWFSPCKPTELLYGGVHGPRHIDLTGIRPSPVTFPETRDKNRNEVRPGDYYPQKEKLFRGGQTPFMKLNLKPYYQSSDGNQTLAWLSAGNQTLDYGYSSVPETRHWIWDWFSAGNQTPDYGLVQCRNQSNARFGLSEP